MITKKEVEILELFSDLYTPTSLVAERLSMDEEKVKYFQARKKLQLLSKREIEVLKLSSDGLSNNEIGTRLYISQITVNSHQTNIKRKLLVKNIANAVSIYIIGKENKIEDNKIVRELEFPVNYVEAGLSLLNQFSSIIKKKYPLSDIKIKIEQEGNKIKFYVISIDDQVLELIEEDLFLFKKIVSGEVKAELITSDPIEILKLKQRLELVALELKMTKQLLDTTANKDLAFIKSQERDKLLLFKILDKSFDKVNFIQITGVSSEEFLTISSNIDELKKEIDKQESDNEKIIQELTEIKEKVPSKAKKIGNFFLDVVTASTKELIKEWIKNSF